MLLTLSACLAFRSEAPAAMVLAAEQYHYTLLQNSTIDRNLRFDPPDANYLDQDCLSATNRVGLDG